MLEQMAHGVRINKTDVFATNVMLNLVQSTIVNTCLCKGNVRGMHSIHPNWLLGHADFARKQWGRLTPSEDHTIILLVWLRRATLKAECTD